MLVSLELQGLWSLQTCLTLSSCLLTRVLYAYRIDLIEMEPRRNPSTGKAFSVNAAAWWVLGGKCVSATLKQMLDWSSATALFFMSAEHSLCLVLASPLA